MNRQNALGRSVAPRRNSRTCPTLPLAQHRRLTSPCSEYQSSDHLRPKRPSPNAPTTLWSTGSRITRRLLQQGPDNRAGLVLEIFILAMDPECWCIEPVGFPLTMEAWAQWVQKGPFVDVRVRVILSGWRSKMYVVLKTHQQKVCAGLLLYYA